MKKTMGPKRLDDTRSTRICERKPRGSARPAPRRDIARGSVSSTPSWCQNARDTVHNTPVTLCPTHLPGFQDLRKKAPRLRSPRPRTSAARFAATGASAHRPESAATTEGLDATLDQTGISLEQQLTDKYEQHVNGLPPPLLSFISVYVVCLVIYDSEWVSLEHLLLSWYPSQPLRM